MLNPSILLAPLPLWLRAIPGSVHAQILSRVINHALRGQTLAQRLAALHGKVIGIDIVDAPARIDFLIERSQLASAAGRAPDVTIRGRIEDFWRLATRAEDPDTLFFHRHLSIEGETATGLHVKNLLDALDYDIDAHVREVLPAPLAETLLTAVTPLRHLVRAALAQPPSIPASPRQ